MTLVANGSGTLAIGKLRGRGVFLNFFASWCEPCQAEVPAIAGLAREYRARGITVVGVDELEPASAAVGFAKRFHIPYAVGTDDSGSIGASYGLIGIPMSVFIGADGRIALRHPGAMDERDMRAALNAIAVR